MGELVVAPLVDDAVFAIEEPGREALRNDRPAAVVHDEALADQPADGRPVLEQRVHPGIRVRVVRRCRAVDRVAPGVGGHRHHGLPVRQPSVERLQLLVVERLLPHDGRDGADDLVVGDRPVGFEPRGWCRRRCRRRAPSGCGPRYGRTACAARGRARRGPRGAPRRRPRARSPPGAVAPPSRGRSVAGRPRSRRRWPAARSSRRTRRRRRRPRPARRSCGAPSSGCAASRSSSRTGSRCCRGRGTSATCRAADRGTRCRSRDRR